MTQTLTREQLKALSLCDNKYLHIFGEHKSMNIEQAFEAGFNVYNICWLMGALRKRKEIAAFTNFCVKQIKAYTDDARDIHAADRIVYWVSRAFAKFDYTEAAHWSVRAARAAVVVALVDDPADTSGAGDSIRKEQKQFLVELLK